MRKVFLIIIDFNDCFHLSLGFFFKNLKQYIYYGPLSHSLNHRPFYRCLSPPHKLKSFLPYLEYYFKFSIKCDENYWKQQIHDIITSSSFHFVILTPLFTLLFNVFQTTSSFLFWKKEFSFLVRVKSPSGIVDFSILHSVTTPVPMIAFQ